MACRATSGANRVKCWGIFERKMSPTPPDIGNSQKLQVWRKCPRSRTRCKIRRLRGKRRRSAGCKSKHGITTRRAQQYAGKYHHPTAAVISVNGGNNKSTVSHATCPISTTVVAIASTITPAEDIVMDEMNEEVSVAMAAAAVAVM